MDVEPVTPTTPRPIGRAFGASLFVQQWRALTFVHWPVAPDLVAPLLPAGTRPDTLDGVTYVGLVPFLMRRVGLLSGPGLPYLGTFCETNVRLYSVDTAGRRGVVFRSLEAARLLPVLAARWAVCLPYMWASMRLRVEATGGQAVRDRLVEPRQGDVVAYTTGRRWPRAGGSVPDAEPVRAALPAATSRAVVRVGAPIAEPSALERFVTARWGLHVAWHGRTVYLPNDHPSWPLHRAELIDLDDRLVVRAGLPAPTGPPASVLYSPGVPVRFGRPLPVA